MTPFGITEHARRDPQKVAITTGDRSLTFAELDAQVNRGAHTFRRRGLREGDTIALSLRNRPEYLEAALAAARVGLTVVPIPWRYQAEEARYIAEDSEAKLVLSEDDGHTLEGLPALHLSEYRAAVARELPTFVEEFIEPAVPPFRFYTSGTTGRPAAIERPPTLNLDLRTMGRLMAGTLAAVPTVAGLAEPNQVHLVVGPLYHTAPSAYALMGLLFGHTLVVMKSFDAEGCLRLIEREQVTWSHMVPINFVRILKLPSETIARYDLSSLRKILHAAAPCPVDVKREIMRVFPPETVWEYYGMSEGALVSMISAEEWTEKPGSVGRPIPDQDVRILDDSGDELPPGEVGSIYMRSHGGVRFEYRGAPERTRDAWRGDRFTVGDVGYLDHDGYLFLTDRKKDMIISGGANIYSAEVEAVLYTHPSVTDVAVIGVPDPEFGEQVKAIVEVRAPVAAGELIDHCRERLAHYKCPTSVDFVDVLPRDPNGKIRKRELREPYWSATARRI